MTEEKQPLYQFHVAGVQFHQLKTCINEVKVGDILQLVPEPSNKWDPNAVRIEFYSVDKGTNIMLGHVPSKKGDYASKVTADISIGTKLRAEVVALNPQAKTWEQLEVAIYEEV